MISLSLMITYIKHLRNSAKTKHFRPIFYIQIDPQDYDEWHTTPPEEEVHFQTPSKLGSPATPRSMATSEASESYITLDTIPTKMDENWLRNGGEREQEMNQTGRELLSCAYTTQLLHSTVEVCWNNSDRYFIWLNLCAKSRDK